jgi:beta-glucosidase
MKKLLKYLLATAGILLGFVIIVLVAGFLWMTIKGTIHSRKYMALAGNEVKTVNIDGFSFRDLNKNGILDNYEDSRLTTDERVNDLISQMDIEEKAGLMFFPPVSMKKDGSISEKPSLKDPFSLMTIGTSEMVFGKKINHFNIFTGTDSKGMAIWYNNLQKLAERTRLGIPVTIGSDPRNSFSNNPLAAAFAGDFSLWPEPTGLAAIGDSSLMLRFADIARQEYLASGIRVALHPMADLATEPRWGRINGTFGEDAALSAKMTYAYVRGFQGDSIGPATVACMTKHFSGGGPQKEGIDPHFPVAKGQIYPGNNFDYHLIPFEAAFRAGTAEVMPYYGIPMDQTGENVGFSFNREMITGLLRNKYHFEGVVCTDWGLLTDVKLFGIMILPARARGMEKATPEERMLKIIDAGGDQFGGEMLPEMLVKLVNDGKITESRIDSSVRRLLRLKFELGLFDDPFVDPENAALVVGNPEFKKEGEMAQRRSIVLLKNSSGSNSDFLPLKNGMKVFLKNVDPDVAGKYATVVGKPEEADVAIIRLKSPSQYIKGTGLFGRLFSSGDLDFKEKELTPLLKLLGSIPSVVDIYLDRPAVIPEIATESKGLLVNFGASDEALLDVIFGKINPAAKLPFELPSSMEAVRNQKEDMPYDSENPLFPFGYGLSYPY